MISAIHHRLSISSLISKEALRRVEQITGKKIKAFHKLDITDRDGMDKVFAGTISLFLTDRICWQNRFRHPLRWIEGRWRICLHSSQILREERQWYDSILHIEGSCVLLDTMNKYNVKNIVFSSSATVYGNVTSVPEGGLGEDLPTGATNPYGRSKKMIEEIITDVHASDNGKTQVSPTMQLGMPSC